MYYFNYVSILSMKKVEKVNRNLRKRKISHVLHSDTYRIEKQYAQYKYFNFFYTSSRRDKTQLHLKISLPVLRFMANIILAFY